MADKALIVEDQEQMARLIGQQLSELHYGKFEIARNAADALERISAARQNQYDLIICDYNLGDGTSGQQLLELLRHERRIPLMTSFIMVTAESQYAQVASAVELVPDAYLLKPFTVDNLQQRIEYARAKRQSMEKVYTLLDQPEPDYEQAMQECSKLIIERNRFALEALKMRAECLMQKARWSEAIAVYDKVITWRPTPWAEVGRAKAIRASGYPEEALTRLKGCIETFPQFVPAYDELADLVQQQGHGKLAQQILEKAHQVVPSNRRTRQLGLIALENNDMENAARYLKIVTEKDRYGLLRSSEDFFGLVKAQRALGKHGLALETLATLKDHFANTPVLEARKLAAECMTLADSGRKPEAKRALRNILEDLDPRLAPQAQLELAEACYSADDAENGRKLLMHVAENWNEHQNIVDKVQDVFTRVGQGDEGARLLKNAKEDLVQLNNRAVRLVREQKLEEALELIEEVAKRLPDNATVQANAAQALLMWLEQHAPPGLMSLPMHSKPRMFVSLARDHLKHLAQANPNHARLAPLQRQFAKITGEILHKLHGAPVAEQPVDALSDGLSGDVSSIREQPLDDVAQDIAAEAQQHTAVDRDQPA